MLHPSTKRLIDKLIEMTDASKITWLEGEDGTCIYDTEGYRVTIGQAPSRVVLLDAGGRVLETVSESILANTTDSNGMQYTLRVDNLVSTARRQITGATDVIDRIVSALELDKDKKPDRKSKDKSEPAPPRPEVTFPDQPEMASRVAMLAAKVNGTALDDVPNTGGAANAASADDAEDYANGSPWNVPDAAGEPCGETVEDYVDADDDDSGFAPAGRTASIDPLPAVDDQPDVLSEATASEPMPDEAFDSAPVAQIPRPDILTSATFGAIGSFGTVGASAADAIGPEAAEDESDADEWIASEKSSEPLSPSVNEAPDTPDVTYSEEVSSPEAVVRSGPAMEGLSTTIDAKKVTPLEYTMPNVVTVEVSEIEAFLAEEAAAAASMPAMELPPTTFLSRTIMAASQIAPQIDPQPVPSPIDEVVDFEAVSEDVVVEADENCPAIETEAVAVQPEPTLKPIPEPEPEPELRGGRRTVYKYNPWM